MDRDSIGQKLAAAVRDDINLTLAAHIEKFAAAYLQMTDIPPDQAILVCRPTLDRMGFEYFFRRKDED